LTATHNLRRICDYIGRWTPGKPQNFLTLRVPLWFG
jgi:hypothetical protein